MVSVPVREFSLVLAETVMLTVPESVLPEGETVIQDTLFATDHPQDDCVATDTEAVPPAAGDA